MNIEIFKRNIKLQELGIGVLSNKEQKIFDFLNENLTNLNTYTLDKYPGYIFMGKDFENFIIQYHIYDKFLYLKYDRIWAYLENEFNMNYSKSKDILKWWIYDKLDLEVGNITTFFPLDRE